MTEEERSILIEAKARATNQLLAVNLSPYRLGVVDKRITEYVREVKNNPEGHCLWEQLAVLRFLRMIDKYGLDKKQVKRFFAVYESLYFPGKKGEQRYRLTPVQCFQFANIYGFWEDGRRIVREAVLFVPRKFSKTTSSAAIAVDDLIFGDKNAESYTAAMSQLQAKKCFDVIRGAIRRLDSTGTYFRVNEDLIKSLMPGRTAIAQCLTASARTKDGLNASTVIMDEFAQARDAGLLSVLTSSMGVRDNPLTVIITTASDKFDGPFYRMLQGYKRVLLGEMEDDTLFAHLFEPDVDDPEDAESTWRKVHPHLGVTVSLDFYRREYQAAQRNGADAMLAFRTKLLNIYAENETRAWISATAIRKYSAHVDLRRIEGRPPAMVSFDLSESRDFTAVSICILNEVDYTYRFHTAYFFPEGALPGHPNEQLYRVWASAGHLRLLPGDVIDYRAVVEYILGLFDHCNVLRIGYDGWKARECVGMLESAIAAKDSEGDLYLDPEDIVTEVPQTLGHFTAPVGSFEHGLKTGKFIIDDNPINAYCFGNAVLDFDRNENCKPVKRSDRERIDGVITKLMCLKLFIEFER